MIDRATSLFREYKEVVVMLAVIGSIAAFGTGMFSARPAPWASWSAPVMQQGAPPPGAYGYAPDTSWRAPLAAVSAKVDILIRIQCATAPAVRLALAGVTCTGGK